MGGGGGGKGEMMTNHSANNITQGRETALLCQEAENLEQQNMLRGKDKTMEMAKLLCQSDENDI